MPIEAACVVVRFSVSGWVSLLVTELAIVMDRPSRTQAVPSPRTRRVWNGDQRSRSRRAGIVLRIGCCVVASVVMLSPPRSGSALRRGRREVAGEAPSGLQCPPWPSGRRCQPGRQRPPGAASPKCIVHRKPLPAAGAFCCQHGGCVRRVRG